MGVHPWFVRPTGGRGIHLRLGPCGGPDEPERGGRTRLRPEVNNAASQVCLRGSWHGESVVLHNEHQRGFPVSRVCQGAGRRYIGSPRVQRPRNGHQRPCGGVAIHRLVQSQRFPQLDPRGCLGAVLGPKRHESAPFTIPKGQGSIQGKQKGPWLAANLDVLVVMIISLPTPAQQHLILGAARYMVVWAPHQPKPIEKMHPLKKTEL